MHKCSIEMRAPITSKPGRPRIILCAHSKPTTTNCMSIFFTFDHVPNLTVNEVPPSGSTESHVKSASDVLTGRNRSIRSPSFLYVARYITLMMLPVSTSILRTTVPCTSIAITKASWCGVGPYGRSSSVNVMGSRHGIFQSDS